MARKLSNLLSWRSARSGSRSDCERTGRPHRHDKFDRESNNTLDERRRGSYQFAARLVAVARRSAASVHSFWNHPFGTPRFLTPRPLGELGEQRAARYLQNKGMKIVARQHRSRVGEIDIIAVDHRTVVFVEVKTRRGRRKGDPAEAVDQRKQDQIAKAALLFLKRRRLLEQPCRFDVVSVLWPKHAKHPEITHFADAFAANGNWQFFQ